MQFSTVVAAVAFFLNDTPFLLPVVGCVTVGRINVTVQLDTNKVRGFLFPAEAQLTWPSLTRSSSIRFPLTQIGNVSVHSCFLLRCFMWM